MFIQPQIIRNSVDAYKVAEELRTKLRGSSQASYRGLPFFNNSGRGLH